VLCLDVGPSMWQAPTSARSKLDEAREALTLFVQQKVSCRHRMRQRMCVYVCRLRTALLTHTCVCVCVCVWRAQVMDGKKTEQVGLLLFGCNRTHACAPRDTISLAAPWPYLTLCVCMGWTRGGAPVRRRGAVPERADPQRD
jgi:hypothetical protein